MEFERYEAASAQREQKEGELRERNRRAMRYIRETELAWKRIMVRRYVLAVLLGLILGAALLFVLATGTTGGESPLVESPRTGYAGADESEDENREDPMENEKIKAALLLRGYYFTTGQLIAATGYDDLPETQKARYEAFGYDTQAMLQAACSETGCPFTLAVAVCWGENEFQSLNHGDVKGYMNISEKNNAERMERLGVTDLMVTKDNFRVGCDLLVYLMDKYEGNLCDVLMHYTHGETGAEIQWGNEIYTTAWIEKVISYKEALDGQG